MSALWDIWITSNNTPFVSCITYNSAHEKLYILIGASSLHNTYHPWILHVFANLLNTGYLTAAEYTELITESGTSEYGCIPVNSSLTHNAVFDMFTGIYAGSEIAADFTITPFVARYPSIVFECGWIESFPQPEGRQRSMDPWLRWPCRAGNPYQI